MIAHARLVCPALLVVLLAACAPMERNYSTTANPPPASGPEQGPAQPSAADAPVPLAKGRENIILFAPVAIGELAKYYPDAGIAFARKEAFYTNLFVSDATGQSSARLPDGADPAWDHGMVAEAAGAHLVVLVKILGFSLAPGGFDRGGRTEDVVALVEMRCLDRNGKTVFIRRATGRAPEKGSPKFAGETNAPQSLSSWQAISTLLGKVRTFYDQQQSLPTASDISVAVESEPGHADVLVDDAFVGTTPITLHLAPRACVVRIERAGFRVWQRHLTPIEGMHIQPILVADPKANASATPTTITDPDPTPSPVPESNTPAPHP